MKPRNVVALALTFVGVFGSINYGLTATASEPKFEKVVIKLGHVGNANWNFHKGALKFSELVKERTNGAVDVQVFPSGLLGSEKDQLEQTRQGIIQMMLVGGMTLTLAKGWEPLNVAYLPFILKQDHERDQKVTLDKIFQMPFMKEMAENARKQSGLRALDLNWYYGMRHVTTKDKPIKGPDDLKNLKIRTMDSPIARLSMDIFGAAVTPMTFPELYSALQMGVINAQENPPSSIYAAKFYEVQKFLSLTGHTTQSMVVIINDNFYNGLSPQLRSVIKKSVAEANAYQTDLQLKDNEASLELLKQKGMTILVVDRSKFAERAKDAWKAPGSGVTKEFYQKFVNAQK